MSDLPPPQAIIEPRKGLPLWRRVSAVWLIPLVALIVSLAVAWRTYDDRGPLIEIVFDSAAGIEAGKTALRFRDVNVGLVETVKLTPDLRRVVASVRVDKDIAQFIDADAEFWVVRPSVTAQGISGLETVVSGVYINSFWDNTLGEPATQFTALPRPPLTPNDQPGLRVRLHAPTGGSMSVGAPVLFKRIQVGKIENIELTPAGDVMVDIFVNAPYDPRLTQGTRFWNASGFDISIGPGGAKLNVESLVSLLQGGVAFDSVGSGTEPVKAGHVFELYGSETAARENAFEDDTGFRQRVNVYFDGSVKGLSAGAPVEFRGIRVGEVSAIQAAITDGERGPKVVLRATLSIMPQRMGIAEGDDAAMAAAVLDLLEAEVNRGMRARLAASGLLSQTLYVDLATMDNPPEGVLNREAEPYPTLPSAPSSVDGLAASAEGVMKRLSSLPIEDLMNTAQTLLANVNAVVSDDRVRAAPENLGLILGDVREILGAPGIQQAPAQLAAILGSVQGIVDQANEQQLVAKLGAALDATKVAVEGIGVAANDSVPVVVAQIEALSKRIQELPVEQLVASGTDLVASVDALVRSEALANLPVSLDASLGEVRGLLAQLREGGAIENASASMASMRKITEDLAAANLAASIQKVATEAEAAIANVNTASADLPALMSSLTDLSKRAGALPLEDLVTAGTRVLTAADGVMQAEGMTQLPAALVGSLDELRAILAQLNEGGAVKNVNATLASADQAAAAITAAAADLPALIAQLNTVAAQADATLASIGPNSQVNQQTLTVLRQVSDAARAVNDLAVALQRKPNSVLFGR